MRPKTKFDQKKIGAELSRRDFIKSAGLAAGGVALGSTALIAAGPAPQAPTPTATVAAQAGAVTLQVYDPGGAFEVTQLFAPRLADLSGKTICMSSNNLWEAQRTLPLIKELLQKQYPTAKFIPYTEFNLSGEMTDAEVSKALKATGCDAVIFGNAG